MYVVEYYCRIYVFLQSYRRPISTYCMKGPGGLVLLMQLLRRTGDLMDVSNVVPYRLVLPCPALEQAGDRRLIRAGHIAVSIYEGLHAVGESNESLIVLRLDGHCLQRLLPQEADGVSIVPSGIAFPGS